MRVSKKLSNKQKEAWFATVKKGRGRVKGNGTAMARAFIKKLQKGASDAQLDRRTASDI